jgi:uncharacterized LabA/DUF88 family protein
MAEKPRLAVLIDGDSVPAQHAEWVFTNIAELGAAKIRRVYCDETHRKNWSPALDKHSLQRRRVGAPKSGKNAADIAMVIDAMDLIRQQKFDGFCIVSSDSDFSRLALRLRREKISVFGFGCEQTPLAFRNH